MHHISLAGVGPNDYNDNIVVRVARQGVFEYVVDGFLLLLEAHCAVSFLC